MFRLLFCLVFILSLFLSEKLYAQVKDSISFNEYIQTLSKDSSFNFAYNPDSVYDCLIAVKDLTSDISANFDQFARLCQLKIEKDKNLFIIRKNKIKKSNLISIHVLDKFSGQGLPYAYVKYDSLFLTCDEFGSLLIQTNCQKVHLQVSYIGYRPLDTLINIEESLEIYLSGAYTKLKEVVVGSDKQLMRFNTSLAVGQLKLNHQLAQLLPGNNNNTLFNLMRLQPGILAAGEQSKDYIIWGSYKGQTQLLYDGITLFSTSNLDNIAVVNPMMIKHIEVAKGGFMSDKGDRVGALVNIHARQGDPKNIKAVFNINNRLYGTYLNIPIGKNSIQFAHRKTLFSSIHSGVSQISSNLYPIQSFQDFNLKLHHQISRTDFISFNILQVDANEFLKSLEENQDYTFIGQQDISRRQGGISSNYKKLWKTGGQTNFSVAFSDLNNIFSNVYALQQDKSEDKIDSSNLINDIQDLRFGIDHKFKPIKQHSFKFGLKWIQNQANLLQDNQKTDFKYFVTSLKRASSYIQDKIRINPSLYFHGGLRIDVPIFAPRRWFIQPRFNLEYWYSDDFILSCKVGKYNQFIAEHSLVDINQNSLFFWDILSSNQVISSSHFVLGACKEIETVKVKSELYYKTLDGLQRFWELESIYEKQSSVELSQGQAKSLGWDIYFSKQIGLHYLWLAYTLSQTLENFHTIYGDKWLRAPQDQRHELKAAFLMRFNPWHFSTNYVFGSGIAEYSNGHYSGVSQFYSRLDLSLKYDWEFKALMGQFGFSIENVMNTQNVRYDNFFSFEGGNRLYVNAQPFTPSVFFKVHF